MSAKYEDSDDRTWLRSRKYVDEIHFMKLCYRRKYDEISARLRKDYVYAFSGTLWVWTHDRRMRESPPIAGRAILSLERGPRAELQK